MTIYLSGPITGHLDHNKPAFKAAEKALRAKGYETINPHELTAHLPEGTSWNVYLSVCLAQLPFCTGIYLLHGWNLSKGSCVELACARELGLQILSETK